MTMHSYSVCIAKDCDPLNQVKIVELPVGWGDSAAGSEYKVLIYQK